MKPGSSLTEEAAEGLAIQALTFIAGDGERLGRFLATTGIGPAQIRAAAQEPSFLLGVLDYLAPDNRTPLLSLYFNNLGVFRISRNQSDNNSDKIASLNNFLDTSLFARLGLPEHLD